MHTEWSFNYAASNTCCSSADAPEANFHVNIAVKEDAVKVDLGFRSRLESYLLGSTNHHPAPLSNEERSGALGPRKGNLAAWRRLGSRAEVPPAPHDPSVSSLSFPLQEHCAINLSPFHSLIT